MEAGAGYTKGNRLGRVYALLGQGGVEDRAGKARLLDAPALGCNQRALFC